VPPLAELLAVGDEPGKDLKFMCAIASELCLDVPDGSFEGVEGLSRVPASIPRSARTALLHAAVKSEAERLSRLDCSKAIVRVGKSMVTELLDKAVAVSDKKARIAAFDDAIVFVTSAEQLCEELAPDVESGKITYEGPLRYRALEDAFSTYLDSTVEDVTEQTSAMLAGLMGEGGFGDPSQMESMGAKAEESEKKRVIFASILKISDGKADKMLQKRMEETQRDMLSKLGNLGDFS